MAQAEQDRLAKNPRWSPNHITPSSASNSSYYFTHATREAARIVFRYGLWPAALAIWQHGTGGGQAAPLVVRRSDGRWVDGQLTADGLQPLPLARLAKEAHARGLVTGAVVHTFNRWQWAEASFTVNDIGERMPIDGLALRLGSGGYRMLDRTEVSYPPMQRTNAAVTYYSAVGALAEIVVDAAIGEVTLLSHHTIVECGNLLVPALVSGQIQGGAAMGIGHALYEDLPLYEDGPGDGTWNFDRYHLPRGSEVAVWRQTAEVLPALSETDPPKGIAEVVMIPIVPAIVNAIAHATGYRFRELQITPERIREALT